MMIRMLLSVGALLLFAGVGAGVAQQDVAAIPIPPSACEPASDIQLYARTLSRGEAGNEGRILVEITLFSKRALRSARISATTSTGQELATSGSSGEIGSLRAMNARKIQQELSLEPGKDHWITFTLSAEEKSGAGVTKPAHLRINLDPSRQPVILEEESLIQYKARPGAKTGGM